MYQLRAVFVPVCGLAHGGCMLSG